jgi:hypothetical protein
MHMKRATLYVIAVVALAAGLVVFKQRTVSKGVNQAVAPPAVVLVADLREADSSNDTCAQIIRVVREARSRGITVIELMPNSDSVVLKNHRIVVAPTVLILDKNGQELSRFEGESVATLDAIRTQVNEIQGDKR